MNKPTAPVRVDGVTLTSSDSTRRRRARLKGATGALASLALLVAVVLAVDSRAVFAQLQQVNLAWLFVSLAASLPQVTALGLRWAHISQGLGTPLRRITAVREYAIGIALNQSLPTGVVGDAVRAFRHGQFVRSSSAIPSAASQSLFALVLDRLSGQVALFTLCLYAIGLAVSQGFVPVRPLLLLVVALLLLGLGGYVTWRVARPDFAFAKRVRSVMAKGGRVLFTPKSFLTHFSLSGVFLASTLVQYWAAGRAAGVPLETVHLVWFGSGILLATSIPTFFAGWGVREGVSAALFALAGMSASDGVATALMFGVFSLVVGWFNAGLAMLCMLSLRLRRVV